ncbi:MAG TPA: PspC domain-containing protein [Acidimicrobiales bacterium]|nr:PspC domain-containing protein [Acidimicrobiales bacterium]
MEPSETEPNEKEPGETEPNDKEPGETEPTETEGRHSARPLRRDTRNRILGGVASGLADYLGVDPAVMRIAFVVLTVFGGSGILLYVAGWVLIPEDRGPWTGPAGGGPEDGGTSTRLAGEADDPATGVYSRSLADEWLSSRDHQPRRSSRILLVGLGVAVALIFLSGGPWWWSGPGGHWWWGRVATGGFTAIVLVAVVAGVLIGHRRHDHDNSGSQLGWVALGALAALATVVGLSIGTAFAAEALTGVPMNGGIGQSTWRPTAANQVSSHYQMAIGNLVVDLSQVDFSPGSTHSVTATVGMGHVLVEVPPGPTVNVNAHSGVGDVTIFGQDDGGIGTQRTVVSDGMTSGVDFHRTAQINLHAEAGLGQVQVVRSS